MITPPFYGTKVVDDLGVGDIEPSLDQEMLFAARWQFRSGQAVEEWQRLKEQKIIPIYERLMSQIRSEHLIAPAVVYGYFPCERSGNGLIVRDGDRAFRFDFPRERETPNRCVADFFGAGFAAFQLVTVGPGPTKAAAERFAKHEYSEAFFLKGLAAEYAEATALYAHRRIREELCAGDAGERFSPGYPSFPDLSAQKKIAALLAPMRIGVRLTETFQLVPEHSTSALIAVERKACHFRP
jgi:5-methyltetrahydrofolate--homocysteine methyltransferase